MAANGGTLPTVEPLSKKPLDEKKTRPNMHSKHKIRMGMTSADIYEGFEERSKKGTQWTCPKCQKLCRTVGFCVTCNMVKSETAQVQAIAEQHIKQQTNAKKAESTSGKKKTAPVVKPKLSAE